MKRLKLWVVCIVLSVMFSSCPYAEESSDVNTYQIHISDEMQILLTSDLKAGVEEVHVKNSSADDWGVNYLKQGEENFSLNPGEKCDLLVVGDDGASYAFPGLSLTGSASCELTLEGADVRLSILSDGQGTPEIVDAVIWYDVPVKMTTLDSLRVRTSPSTDQDNAVAMLKPGDIVDVYGVTGIIGDRPWAVIRTDGEWRYVAADFLKDSPEDTADSVSASDDTSAGDEFHGEDPASGTKEETEEQDASKSDPENQDEDTDLEDSPAGLEVSEKSSEPVSDGFIGPIQQLPVRETMEVRSFLDPGSVYLFTTYEDGSVTAEIHSAENQ